MAQLNYTLNSNDSANFHNMRTLNFDALVGTQPVFAFNAFIVRWSEPGAFFNVSLLGDDLNPTFTGNSLTGLTGTRITGLTVFAADFNIGLNGLDLSADGFVDLVLAKDWSGLAAFVRQGDDRVLGTVNADFLLGGDGDDTFVSGLGRDWVNGGRGNDTLEASAGHDILIGGKGADTFAFEAPPEDGYAPVIKDFKHGTDRIAVEDIVFNHVGFGGFDGAPMEEIHFGYGRQAKTPDQGLIYNIAKGFLYYDPDGSGTSGDKVLVAKLGAGTALSFDDFWVV